MLRRDFVKLLAATGYLLATPAFLRRAQAATGFPLADLAKALDPQHGVLVQPNDAGYADYNISYNKLTQLSPQARVMVKSAAGVATTLAWAKRNSVPFAVRCGGHSYAGFSQSSALVIDTRLMNNVDMIDPATVRVGGGAALGHVYDEVAKHGLAVPAGSCPTVGITGHLTGGGFGLLGRAFGLACDGLLEVEMVTADTQVVRANATQNSDLLWACQGGGGGNFGVITELTLKAHALPEVSVYRVGWSLAAAQALKVVHAWQAWAPSTARAITSVMVLSRVGQSISIRCIGQSVDSASHLQSALQDLVRGAPTPTQPLNVSTMSFDEATHHFGGSGLTHYPTTYMAGKSDYVKQPLDDRAILAWLNSLLAESPGAVAAICDSYGGAVEQLASDATAFAHRSGTLFGIQYASYWSSPAQTTARKSALRNVYQAVHPHASGGAYVNYPDLELADYKTAYWGENLNRLLKVKAERDPENVFRHAQSLA